jgi:Protein of unknown function (DUF2514).
VDVTNSDWAERWAKRDAGDAEVRARTEAEQRNAERETSKLSAATAAGPAKAETARLLAELLRDADRRAGIYAAEADRAYVVGSSCERTYNKVTANNSSGMMVFGEFTWIHCAISGTLCRLMHQQPFLPVVEL